MTIEEYVRDDQKWVLQRASKRHQISLIVGYGERQTILQLEDYQAHALMMALKTIIGDNH